jgi:hypothetical protein
MASSVSRASRFTTRSAAIANPTTPLMTAPTAPKAVVVNTNVTEAEVLAAQKARGEALVSISTTYEEQGLPRAYQFSVSSSG